MAACGVSAAFLTPQGLGQWPRCLHLHKESRNKEAAGPGEEGLLAAAAAPAAHTGSPDGPACLPWSHPLFSPGMQCLHLSVGRQLCV